MKKIFMTIVIIIGVAFSSCSSSGERAAKEIASKMEKIIDESSSIQDAQDQIGELIVDSKEKYADKIENDSKFAEDFDRKMSELEVEIEEKLKNKFEDELNNEEEYEDE